MVEIIDVAAPASKLLSLVPDVVNYSAIHWSRVILRGRQQHLTVFTYAVEKLNKSDRSHYQPADPFKLIIVIITPIPASLTAKAIPINFLFPVHCPPFSDKTSWIPIICHRTKLQSRPFAVACSYYMVCGVGKLMLQQFSTILQLKRQWQAGVWTGWFPVSSNMRLTINYSILYGLPSSHPMKWLMAMAQPPACIQRHAQDRKQKFIWSGLKW